MAVESKYMPLDGANAVSQAMRQIDPDVVAAYPITPQTAVVQNFSQYVADGIVHTEFVPVESEHAAMSACIGSEAAGGRTMTATAANGLALMWETLYIAAGMRLPIAGQLLTIALGAEGGWKAIANKYYGNETPPAYLLVDRQVNEELANRPAVIGNDLESVLRYRDRALVEMLRTQRRL